jgi:hypothetical protein
MSERSYGETRDLVGAALNAGRPPDNQIWLCPDDVYAGYCVYEIAEKSYKVTYSIDDAGNVTLGQPEAVTRTVTYQPVVGMAFSLGPIEGAAGEYVERDGVIFEAGNYPDKGAAYSADDIHRMSSGFAGPMPIESLEHDPSILGGKLRKHLGSLLNVFAKDGKLYGKVRVPTWLANIYGKEPIKVSIELVGGKIDGLSYTGFPRVSDAALMTAFSSRKGTSMSLKDRIKAALFGAIEKIDIEDDGAPSHNDRPTFSAGDDELKRQLMTARKALQRSEAGRIGDAATQFASGMVREGYAVPAEAEYLAAQYRQAVVDDNAGKTCFSADGTLVEGERVANLRKAIEARPKHNLTEEQLRDGVADKSLRVVMSTGGPETKEAPVIDVYEVRRRALEKKA